MYVVSIYESKRLSTYKMANITHFAYNVQI